MAAWYTALSFHATERVWIDVSGNNHSATVDGSASSVTVHTAADPASTNYLNGQAYVTGTANGVVRFPPGLLTNNYTLFYVARYAGTSRGRIFSNGQGVSSEWLSGFWDDRSGVAHHGIWITPDGAQGSDVYDLHSDAWVLATDQMSLFRSQGVQRSTRGTSMSGPITPCINCYSSQSSDWAVAAVLVYDRLLDLGTIVEVEGYLADLYGLQALGRSQAGAHADAGGVGWVQWCSGARDCGESEGLLSESCMHASIATYAWPCGHGSAR